MARTKGSSNLAASLEILAEAPVDARTVVAAESDLTVAANFPYAYVGMPVYVKATQKMYVLTATPVTTASNWKEVGSGGSSLPSGGTTGQALVKHSNTDQDVEWATIDGTPSGGTTGQLLAKKSNTDGDVEWVNAPSSIPDGGTAGQVLAKHSNTDKDVEWIAQNNAISTIDLSDVGATYDNADLVGNGETKIFYSYWRKNVVHSSAGLPRWKYYIEANANYFVEMTKLAGGSYAVQRCRIYYTYSNVDYCEVYERHMEKQSGGTWSYGDWVQVNNETELPSGGTTGQILAKHSATDGDVEWINAPTGGVGYDTKSLANNFTYNDNTLVADGDTKLFYSFWGANTSYPNCGLPNVGPSNRDRLYYIEMTKAPNGDSFIQRCRLFYSDNSTPYARDFERRCYLYSTWEYSDWCEIGATANIPVTPNQFDKANMYSTTEKVIGSWTDGRPLYQKTVSWGLITSGNNSKNHNISNINTITDCKGYWVQDNTYFGPIGERDAGNATLYVYADKTKIYFVASSEFGDGKTYAYITLQYTKTTDAANSFNYASENDYSTTEHRVGTWIDGKPLYQKTINVGKLTNNASKTVPHSVNNLKRVVKFSGYFSNSSGLCGPICFATSGSSNNIDAITVWRDGANIVVNCLGDRTNYTECYVTIQYTKTTD